MRGKILHEGICGAGLATSAAQKSKSPQGLELSMQQSQLDSFAPSAGKSVSGMEAGEFPRVAQDRLASSVFAGSEVSVSFLRGWYHKYPGHIYSCYLSGPAPWR